MKYLSLYKTSSEHSSDNSRLVPNISLITDEKKMILTNENNIGTIFEPVDIIESFDDIINRFPTGNFTGMPGLKIYGDNTGQSIAKNRKLFNDAQQWRSNYISNNGLSDGGQEIRINVDALLIDNIIIDKYDNSYRYNYHIDIYNDCIILYGYRYGLNLLKISNDGSVTVDTDRNIFPSPSETAMPSLKIYTNNMSDNMRIYEDFQRWREDYISLNGLNDPGQVIRINVDALKIDNIIMDPYDRYYRYHIDIDPNSIMLLNNNSEEILTISSDSLITILDIFNKFPYPTGDLQNMPGLNIYTDNTSQSKEINIKLYNNAIQYRKDYISYNGLGDTAVIVKIDALIIDNETIDKYEGGFNAIDYYINIYNDHIDLENTGDHERFLTIYGDGSIDIYVMPTPKPDSDTTTTMTPTPDIDTTTTKHPHI